LEKITNTWRKKIIELYDDVLPVMGKEIGDYLKNNNIYVKTLRIFQK
jgi:hypothetical protein